MVFQLGDTVPLDGETLTLYTSTEAIIDNFSEIQIESTFVCAQVEAERQLSIDGNFLCNNGKFIHPLGTQLSVVFRVEEDPQCATASVLSLPHIILALCFAGLEFLK